MSLNKIISMVFLLLSLGGVSSHAAQGPSSEMDEGADGPEAVSSVSHAPLPHPDHLLFHEASLGQWIGLETQGELELRGLTQVGYDGLAGEMQGGGLAQYANLLPYGDFFGGMVRRPQELEGSRIEDSLLGLLGSVPEGHSVQILGYPSLWKPDSRMSYVVIHRESTERDAEVSLEDLTEVFHRDQTAFLIVAAKAIGREDIDPSSYIGQLNRFGKISLADCLSTLPIISINRPGFPRSFVVEQLYKEGATSPAAQMRLGAFYSQQNKKVLARQYYKQEADQGKLEAQYQFAVMCYHGQGGEVNRPMARQCFQLSADQGYKIAQHSFAVMCSEGQGGDVNLPMARQYFKLAADQGYEKAQTKFSVMCLKGEGGDVDLPMARQYFKLAADQGQLESQTKFFDMCLKGGGGDVDLPMARQYFKLAADQGQLESQHQFAVMCYHGQGGEVNLPMARQYSQLAADQGHALAQDSFALMCSNGEGGEIDLPRARQYFKLAADQGHALAQDSFALMCFNGEGGDVNLPMARQYFQLAADQGHEGAQRVLLTLSSHTPHEAEARPKRGDDQDDRSPKRRRMDDRGA
jgi:TPR repeat protein